MYDFANIIIWIHVKNIKFKLFKVLTYNQTHVRSK